MNPSGIDVPAVVTTGDLAPSEIAVATTEQLLDELRRSIQITAERIAYMAVIWVELEERGADLDPYRTTLTQVLPRVARGQIASAVVVRCLGNLTLLDRIARLPIEQQTNALDEVVEVVDRRSARREVRRIPVAELSAADARLALDEETGKPVPTSRQTRALTAATRSRRPATPSIELDGDVVVIGRLRVDAAYLRRQLDRLGWNQ